MKFQIDWEPALVTTAASVCTITAGTSRPVWVVQLCIGFDGVTAAQIPLEIQVLRASAVGTGTGRTLIKADATDGNSIVATGTTLLTAEPTYTDMLFRAYLHCQTPPLIWQPPPRTVCITGAGMMGVRSVGTPSPDVSCVGYLILEE